MFKIVASRKSNKDFSQQKQMEGLFMRKGTMPGDENLLEKVQKRFEYFEKLEEDDQVDQVQASMAEENRIKIIFQQRLIRKQEQLITQTSHLQEMQLRRTQAQSERTGWNKLFNLINSKFDNQIQTFIKTELAEKQLIKTQNEFSEVEKLYVKKQNQILKMQEKQKGSIPLLAQVLVAAKKEKRKKENQRQERIDYILRPRTREDILKYQAYQVSSRRLWKDNYRPHERDAMSMLDLRKFHRRYKINKMIAESDNKFGQGPIKYKKKSVSGERFGKIAPSIEPLITFGNYCTYLQQKLEKENKILDLSDSNIKGFTEFPKEKDYLKVQDPISKRKKSKMAKTLKKMLHPQSKKEYDMGVQQLKENQHFLKGSTSQGALQLNNQFNHQTGFKDLQETESQISGTLSESDETQSESMVIVDRKVNIEKELEAKRLKKLLKRRFDKEEYQNKMQHFHNLIPKTQIQLQNYHLLRDKTQKDDQKSARFLENLLLKHPKSNSIFFQNCSKNLELACTQTQRNPISSHGSRNHVKNRLLSARTFQSSINPSRVPPSELQLDKVYQINSKRLFKERPQTGFMTQRAKKDENERRISLFSSQRPYSALKSNSPLKQKKIMERIRSGKT